MKYEMISASILLHGDLEQLLPTSMPSGTFVLMFGEHTNIKHLVESLGIPHTEIAFILLNGQPANQADHLSDRAQLEVFPYSHESSHFTIVEEPETCEQTFILDNHLGRLASYLRMLGFDSLYENTASDAELASQAVETRRILLTRDRQLLMRKSVQRGYLVRSNKAPEQTAEVIRRFQLQQQIAPFRRCQVCNGFLEPVEKEAIIARLEPLTRQYFDEFSQCHECQKIYWKGSHYQRMSKYIATLI